MNVRVDILRFVGDTWKNCGDTPGQNAALRNDQALSKTLSSSYGTVFGQNQDLFKNLTTNLQKISNAGVGQQGFSPEELAARNGQSVNDAAASNQKIQTAIGENAASHGISGSPGVESGVEQAVRASAATAVDSNLNNQLAETTKENYATGRQNYWNSIQEQPAIASTLENADTNAAGAASGANKITGEQANENAKSSTGTELLGLGEGLASDAASAIKFKV